MSYSQAFFADRETRSRASAQEIVPWLLRAMRIRSVVDVGCGTGSWLAEFRDNGIADYLGLDGPWVPVDYLQIPSDRYQAVDLAHQSALTLAREFDLVVCLEMAEHLPAAQADALIARLVSLGPRILFSAAIPDQGGTNHANEQWPGYWIEQFQRYEYTCIDCLREHFWDNPRVAPWYAQNMFLFVSADMPDDCRALTSSAESNGFAFRPVVHPTLYLARVRELSDPQQYSLRAVIKALPFLLSRALRRRCAGMR